MMGADLLPLLLTLNGLLFFVHDVRRKLQDPVHLLYNIKQY